MTAARTLLLALALVAVAIGSLATGDTGPDCEEHDPIVIAGDHGPTGFALAPGVAGEQTVHRPGSGVRAGSGTAEDPYVISGWCFSPTQRPNVDAARSRGGQAILIAQTDAHVVVEDNRIEGQGEPANFGRGIVLEGAENVTIRSNAIEAVDWYGVDARGGSDIDVDANTITSAGLTGLRVVDVHALEATSNEVHDIERGLHLNGTEQALVEDNRVTEHASGLHLDDTTGTRVAANTFSGGQRGLLVEGGEAIAVAGNRIADHGEVGIELDDADDLAIEANTFVGNEEAVAARWADGLTLTGNRVTGGYGVEVRYGEQPTLAGNELVDVGIGIHLEGTRAGIVDENELSNVPAGVVVWEANGTVVTGNRLEEGRVGLTVGRSQGTHVVHNAIADHTNLAVSLPTTQDIRLEANELVDSGTGVAIDEGSGHALHGNEIAGHAWRGLAIHDVETPVDARENWWGHGTGPSGGVADACTDAVADGEGATIEARNARVCFDPWLAEPTPAAGPS